MSVEPVRHVAPLADVTSEASFSVQAIAPVGRARRSLKHNDTFLVLDARGDIGASAGTSDGLFQCDTRFLSRLELLINDVQPLLLASNLSDDNLLLTIDLTNPDFVVDGHVILEKDTIHIVRSIFIWNETAHQRIGLRNHGVAPVVLDLTIKFDADFADLFEVRGTIRRKRGLSESKIIDLNTLRYIYRGLDNVVRQSTVHFHPQPAALDAHEARYRLELPAGASSSLFVTANCTDFDSVSDEAQRFTRTLLSARREMRGSTAGSASIGTTNEVFNEMLCRGAADLRMLTTETPQGPYPYAGIPWFSTTFGRDGIITALQMMWLVPEIARGVLRRLAAYQALADDPDADAQPGKILHEMRGGEMAALHEIPFGLYYGSVDSTPLFVLLAGLYFDRTGDRETIAELWPAIDAALNWIDGPGDIDKDGFVEYRRLSADGLANQGWKDSYDAIFHDDGRLAEGNIALVEVQGYVFAAKQLAARCARSLGFIHRARALEAEAERLAENFERAFWCPEIGSYALALDGAKNPCRVRSSNGGQVLLSGIASRERAVNVANTLLGANSFSGWGIRTVAKNEARYNPMSYHDGSVWPHDNALIALGFSRYGLKDSVLRVFGGLFAAAKYMDLRRLPELFCGFQRQPQRGPTLYPVACAPQAWASAVPFALLAASLGFEFDTERMEVRLRDPQLPPFLDEVVIRGLRLRDAEADLRIQRGSHHDVALEVTRSKGTIRFSIVPPA
jgi:glycogen debranching enzyme